MQLSDTERQRLTTILAQYDQHPEVQRMREFIQHGDVTTYQHCKNVVLVSFWLNRRFHLGADETSLAVGAFLHDFYLYDWHKRSSFRGLRRLFEMHGFAHPGSACVNAERCFAITRKEQNIISSHMWPLTFRHVPTCREAVIVCLADKYCAVLDKFPHPLHFGVLVILGQNSGETLTLRIRKLHWFDSFLCKRLSLWESCRAKRD